MEPIATHANIKDLEKVHAVEQPAATGQVVKVRFFPGLGYAPCIDRDLLDGKDQGSQT